MPVLLDSDVAIELLRGNKYTHDCLSCCAETVYVSTITAAELYYGAFHSKRSSENVALVDRFLEQLPRLAFTDKAARVFGVTKEKMYATKKTIDTLDLMIASIALASGCTVVTGNTRHFAKVPGLLIENWISQ